MAVPQPVKEPDQLTSEDGVLGGKRERKAEPDHAKKEATLPERQLLEIHGCVLELDPVRDLVQAS